MPTDVTVSVKTTGGDYSSLVAAEAGEQRDLVAVDEQSIIEPYPMIDTSNNITFAGWGTDDTHWVIVRTPASNSHAGVWDDGVWYQKTSLEMMLLQVRNIKLIGLQFMFRGILSAFRGLVNTGGSIGSSRHHILKCIFRGVETTSGGTYDAIRNTSNNFGIEVFINNCLFYDFNSGSSRAVRNNTGISTTRANNNTIVDMTWGLWRQYNTIVSKNNLCFNVIDGYVNGMSAGSINNAYSEGADPGSAGLDISGYAGADIFEDYANDNFHLKAGSPCIDMGADLTADSTMILKDDIDGALRTGTWDIGADERTALTVSRLKKPQDRLLRAMLMR